MKVSNSNLINVALEKQQQQMKQLVSGKKVESAKDDAANLQIANRLFSELSGTQVAARNANDAISYASVADSALSSIEQSNDRANELAIRASNASLSAADRQALNQELQQVSQQVNDIASNTQFAGQNIFQQRGGESLFQVSSQSNKTLSLPNINISEQVNALSELDLTQVTGAQSAIESTKGISEALSSARVQLGAFQNRAESTISNLNNQAEQAANSRGRIVDTDYAKTTANSIKNALLVDVGIAMKSQANVSQQYATKLLGIG